MTREQAINYLYSSGFSEGQVKAVVEALTDEDAISREEVHDLLVTWLNDYLTDETRDALEVIDAKIEDLPSVTPSVTNDIEKSNFDKRQYRIDTDTAYQCGYEQGKKDSRRKGHWEDIPFSNYFKCSECGCYQISNTEFCPKCGAEMRGAE